MSNETTINGKKVAVYRLENGNGMSAEITNYGARVVKLLVPDKKGDLADVVLSFDTIEEITTIETYFNATCGRFANRIKNGKFTLDGKEYALAVNNGPNHLHGGLVGFNMRVWDVKFASEHEIVFHYFSPDGEEGYPGNLDVNVTYKLTENNELKIHYEATTDKATVIGLTNHSYFNLKGAGEGLVHDHYLQLNADFHTLLDDFTCPTGEVVKVDDSPYDFREPALLADRINDPVYANNRGLDDNWVIRKNQPGELVNAGYIYEPASGRKMEVITSLPGVQIYTANWVEKQIGKYGKQYEEQCAICLEAQGFPNSPNFPHFPSSVLRPGGKYDEWCIYKFSAE
ncbi:MAG: aldose epimerase family protein [Paludibacteraceae bacterium]